MFRLRQTPGTLIIRAKSSRRSFAPNHEPPQTPTQRRIHARRRALALASLRHSVGAKLPHRPPAAGNSSNYALSSHPLNTNAGTTANTIRSRSGTTPRSRGSPSTPTVAEAAEAETAETEAEAAEEKAARSLRGGAKAAHGRRCALPATTTLTALSPVSPRTHHTTRALPTLR